jgi:predicted O-methyltransferase YrrM
MDIISKEIENYIVALMPVRDPILDEMEKMGERRNFPIVGPMVGRFLYQMATAVGARRIFEMGSGYGYSAYWFAKALPDGGKIICTEGSADNAKLAHDFLSRGGLGNKIDFRVGDALQIIEKESGPYDIIFNDVDKEHYPEVFKKALPRLRKGGLFISDNVLWHGRVVSPDGEKSTQGILKFNKMVYESKDVFTTIVPLRDGLAVCVKM